MRFLQAQLRLRRAAAPLPGQGLVEYSLVLVLIAVTCIAIMSAMGTNLSRVWYEQIIGAFDSH
ncbi:pilus assembly protein [Chloroflexia bacterium SDU3-3]|nr:pilus assembly protein [Chloroflexia bacterium SDU3-3]